MPSPAEPTETPDQDDAAGSQHDSDPASGDPAAYIASLGTKHRSLTPDDPVGAARRAHAERISYAERLHDEGRYTDKQLEEFRVASETELRQDIAAANGSE